MNTILALEIYDLTCPSNRNELKEDMCELEYYNNHYDENYVLVLFEV